MYRQIASIQRSVMERPSSSNLHVDNTHGSSRISAIRTDAHVDTLEVVKMKIQGLERMAGEAS